MIQCQKVVPLQVLVVVVPSDRSTLSKSPARVCGPLGYPLVLPSNKFLPDKTSEKIEPTTISLHPSEMTIRLRILGVNLEIYHSSCLLDFELSFA
ncbi:hypothetical protein CEXT_636681 [Caerostris extrusa]|uniref:Uncharacterized protein n=1 Tax=Caerostris extrusa TaxID=172846 RepID=A0AAV4QI33_CAEEX|nr:hypothetical protein CEXT_636681 [Caerostris extrusa]